jgi:DNA replication protein DnaC
MRDLETWRQNWMSKLLKEHLPPRIVRDLILIEFSELPDIEIDNTFIYGEVGTGKTLHAARLFIKYLETCFLNNKRIYVKFESFPQLLSNLRKTYNNPNISEDSVMEVYLTVDLLVLDDFFTTRPTDWTMDIVYYLINYRYEHLLPTIITSNNDLAELEELLQDQRITGRINRAYHIIKKNHYNKND